MCCRLLACGSFFIEQQILKRFFTSICVSLLAKEDYKYMVFTGMIFFPSGSYYKSSCDTVSHWVCQIGTQFCFKTCHIEITVPAVKS